MHMEVGTWPNLTPGGIFSHKNRQGCNNISGRITIWDHGEDTTQDIPKVCHHDQKGETASICSNIKYVVLPTTKRATVMQEVGKGYWGIRVTDQPIWPICGKKYDKLQTHASSMVRGRLKGVACQQLWNHQVCRIPVNNLWRTHGAQGKCTWIFGNVTQPQRTRKIECIHDKIHI